MSFGLNALRPQKVIAFAANKGGFYNVNSPSFPALTTPGLLIAGELDSTQRRNVIENLFDQNRPRGARWAWVEEEAVGHSLADSLEIILPFVAAMSETRYPSSLTSVPGPPSLLTPSETDGWLVTKSSFRDGFALTNAYSATNGNAFSLGWLPNRRLAFIFRAFASHHKALTTARLSPNAPFIRTGESITYQLSSLTTGWSRIRYYDGDLLLREVTPTDRDPFDVTTSPGTAGYAVLHAIVTTNSGDQRTTMPRRMLVLPRLVVAPPPPPSLPDLALVEGPDAVERGDSFSFAVEVEDQPGITYFWTRDEQPVPGATSPQWSVPVALPGHAGSYQLTATLGALQKSTSPHVLAVTNSSETPGKLLNLSVRGNSVDEAHPLVAGFVLTGEGTKPILLRAIGPGLESFDASDAMSDPSLSLLRLSDPSAPSLLGSNSQWHDSAGIELISARVGAFPLAPTSLRRCDIIATPRGALYRRSSRC